MESSTRAARTPAPAAPRAPRRPGRETRVRDILDAARHVFTHQGYDAAAVSDIAARCGVAQGTVYKYFDSKRELLLKVLADWYDEMFGDTTRELRALEGTRPKLRYLIGRHLRTIRDNPALSALMFVEVRSQPGYVGSELHALNRRYTSMLTRVLEDGVALGDLRADTPVRAIRDLLYGGIEHLAWRYLSGRGGLDVDASTEQVLAMLWGGIAAPDAASRARDATDAGLLRVVAGLAERVERLEARATPRRTHSRRTP